MTDALAYTRIGTRTKRDCSANLPGVCTSNYEGEPTPEKWERLQEVERFRVYYGEELYFDLHLCGPCSAVLLPQWVEKTG